LLCLPSFCIIIQMPLKLILKEVPMGLPPTPKQSAQREKFTRAAKDCHEAFKDSKLKGTTKVLAMNRFMKQNLQKQEQS